MKTRPRRGRKPLPKGEKHTERYVVYLTPPEAKLLEKDCIKRNMSPGALLTSIWLEWRAAQEG